MRAISLSSRFDINIFAKAVAAEMQDHRMEHGDLHDSVLVISVKKCSEAHKMAGPGLHEKPDPANVMDHLT
jgi:hypothetical protein